MYVYLNVYLCTMYRSPQRPEKALGHLELELQQVLMHMCVLGTECGSSVRAASAFPA